VAATYLLFQEIVSRTGFHFSKPSPISEFLGHSWGASEPGEVALFMAEIIGPQSVPKKFDRFPKGMAVRRASATNPLS